MDGTSDAGTATAAGGRRSGSFESNRRSMTLQQLQHAIKSVMLTDAELHAKLQAGLQGIGSLARETHQLRVNRDETGATCEGEAVPEHDGWAAVCDQGALGWVGWGEAGLLWVRGGVIRC